MLAIGGCVCGRKNDLRTIQRKDVTVVGPIRMEYCNKCWNKVNVFMVYFKKEKEKKKEVRKTPKKAAL